jgi:hypothetical protein
MLDIVAETIDQLRALSNLLKTSIATEKLSSA